MSDNPHLTAAIEHLRRRESEVVLKALNARIAPGESFVGRLTSVVTPGGTTYALDGVPFVWVGAPRVEQSENGQTISVDREWKELP